jgi:hypothetical protein
MDIKVVPKISTYVFNVNCCPNSHVRPQKHGFHIILFTIMCDTEW